MAKLIRDIRLNLWGAEFTLPAGTRVTLIKGASGTKGDLYAVSDTKLLMDLTGNRHDPKYRYAFVKHEDVGE